MATSFNDLTQAELYRAAVEDFAVEVKKSDSKQSIIAALVESGVNWALYLQAHPELAPVVETQVSAPAPGVITTDTVVVQPEPRVVRTATPAVTSVEDLYLVKMNRDNPYFEFRKFKFTKENPFAVMDAASADALLNEEEGFAIAKPSEAAQYYA